MKFPGELSDAAFLEQHWQKQALRMPAAFPPTLPLLEAEELAWLATLDDVESRIVFSERDGPKMRYRVESGPFTEAYLEALPTQDWTLLVQDVEKHLPDFRAWFSLLEFVPEWRIDDLMITFAAPGGSVGPHVDNYDVFLCQVQGQRRWSISAQNIVSDPQASDELSLLQPFDDADPFLASPGDSIYLPPGIAHWGVAVDNCMTYSLGMRAPSREELRCTFDRLFENAENPFAGESNPAVAFYRDPDLGISEKRTHLSDADFHRCRKLLRTGLELSSDSIADTLGCTVTDVKAWLDPQYNKQDVKEFLNMLAPADIVDLHGMARVALHVTEGRRRLYLNGAGIDIPRESLSWVEELCRARTIAAAALLSAENQRFVRQLFKAGLFDLTATSD